MTNEEQVAKSYSKALKERNEIRYAYGDQIWYVYNEWREGRKEDFSYYVAPAVIQEIEIKTVISDKGIRHTVAYYDKRGRECTYENHICTSEEEAKEKCAELNRRLEEILRELEYEEKIKKMEEYTEDD